MERAFDEHLMVSLSRLALLCVPLAACGEYAHTNPYDPATDVTLVINGPDSAHSMHEYMTFTYEITPNWKGVVPQWSSENGGVVAAAGGGVFQVTSLGSTYVRLSLGTHVARHRVVTVQTPRHVVFCYAGPCPTSVALGGVLTLGLVQTDSIGFPVGNVSAQAQVQYNVRPSGVLQVLSGTTQSVQVQAIGSGRAYVIAALGSFADSLAITVQ